jgi:putative flippase GtrA
MNQPHNNARKALSPLAQFFLFAGIGLVGTAVLFALLFIQVQYFAINPVWASAVGFSAGAVVNYILNYRYTFRSSIRHRTGFPRFYGIALIGLLLNTLLMELLVEMLALYYLLAQLIASTLVLLWNFTANRTFTFGNRPSKP